ncbi:FAR1-related sequence 10 [Tanacetum coccineum]
MDQIESNPKILIKAIQDQLQKKYLVEISRMKAFRAKSKDVDHVRGDYTSRYHMLRSYVIKLKAFNPNTTVRIETSFKACLRDFLGFDGAFMKGPFPGQVLTNVGIDSNNGIISAIEALFPAAEHRAMDSLKDFNKDCYDWLCEIPPQHSARYHFSGRSKTNMLLNNMCEVLNGQLLDGRDRHIISTLEYAREYMMKRIVIVKQAIVKYVGPLTPTTTRLFQDIKDEASEYTCTFNGGHLYGVSGPWQDQQVIDVLHRTCTCRKWELTGMSCKHVMAVNWNMAANNM